MICLWILIGNKNVRTFVVNNFFKFFFDKYATENHRSMEQFPYIRDSWVELGINPLKKKKSK